MRRRLAILRGAAWLVPREQRAEWLAEWRSALWYVWRTGNRQPRGATAFCLGAFKGGLWLRRNSPELSVRERFWLESPLQCCLFLAVLAAASSSITFRLPHHDSRDLVMISHGGRSVAPLPTIAIEEYRSLTPRTQSRFMRFAFYRPVLTRAHGVRADLSIALASGNL